MDLEQILSIVSGIPHMGPSQALELTSFIQSNNLRIILELGFRHGVSSCYIAGALDENKTGHLTTIDLESARTAQPNIDHLLSKLGLSSYVTVYYEPTSYIWRLMKLIEEHPTPVFDFCFIDGAHDWYTDGFAFFLVDKLLLPGGWILFDDLHWTYGESPSWKDTDRVRNMPNDERDTPQVMKIYELLVKTHPEYHNFIVNNDWGYAQKRRSKHHSDTL